MNKKIGMFDSGIGGLTILKELKKLLPNEDYIYYADSKNNPYGEKSDTAFRCRYRWLECVLSINGFPERGRG